MIGYKVYMCRYMRKYEDLDLYLTESVTLLCSVRVIDTAPIQSS